MPHDVALLVKSSNSPIWGPAARSFAMYAVVRRYTSSTDLSAEIERLRDSLEQVMRSIPGFVAYYLVNGGDSVATITVCTDRAGTDESNKRAAEWVKQNLPNSGLGAPEITAGNVMVGIGQSQTAAR
jgi:hypothetical protein